MWGLYSHSRKYRRILFGSYFWNMYSHLRKNVNGYSGCTHTPLMPRKRKLGELISGANACGACILFAPGWIQDNTPCELFFVLVLCQGVWFPHHKWKRRTVCKKISTASKSGVPKRGRSKRGRSQKHANERKWAQMCAKERKRKSTKERKRAQMSDYA